MLAPLSLLQNLKFVIRKKQGEKSNNVARPILGAFRSPPNPFGNASFKKFNLIYSLKRRKFHACAALVFQYQAVALKRLASPLEIR